ncbi:hypothetical protein [Pedobacter sp. NJ-S-72]
MMISKKIAYIGCLGMIGIISTEFGVIGVLPQIAAHYQITIDKAGVLLSAFALVIALTGPFMTLLASGFDRKKVMLVACYFDLFNYWYCLFFCPAFLVITDCTHITGVLTTRLYFYSYCSSGCLG